MSKIEFDAEPLTEALDVLSSVYAAFQVQMACAVGIPPRLLYATVTEASHGDLATYYERIERALWPLRRSRDHINFVVRVRPMMKNRRTRRPKFARCWR